jgi:tRNA(Ile)-lysidine synthase
LAADIPANEEEARVLRYRFLEGLLDAGARWILTAHHEDDQVETILFRVVRGTGIEGLRGIPEVREPGILRPLLSFSRKEIERYAGDHHLRPRLDSSNRSQHPARNRIRHSLLPALIEIHPGAGDGLLRLARHAESATRALDLLLLPLRDELIVDSAPSSVVLDRDALLALDESVGCEILRRLAHGLGGRLSEAGTAIALEFIRKGPSGKVVQLGDALILNREFGRLTLSLKQGMEPVRAHLDPELPSLSIPTTTPGRGEILIQDRVCEIVWGERPSDGGWSWLDLPEQGVHLPLTVRGWTAGDRMLTQGGEKKLKKLFLELRIPVRDRTRMPLLVDAKGEVLWIAGWRSSASIPPSSDAPRWGVGVRFANDG